MSNIEVERSHSAKVIVHLEGEAYTAYSQRLVDSDLVTIENRSFTSAVGQ
jgi:hypothetical protein